MRTPLVCPLILSLSNAVVLVGCPASGWDGRVESWGEMRPVMREGQTQARVQLSEVIKRPHVYGVGAVEGLDGEIVIDNGRCWVARVIGPSLVVSPAPDSPATLLIVSHVPAWTPVFIDHPLLAESVDGYVRAAAERAGIDTTKPFPFVIEGEFADVLAHVVNGYCPKERPAPSVERDHQPFQISRKSIRGKLIGFYAADSAGRLTHHGTETHIHLLVEPPNALAGHVETISIASGATLRIPTQ